MTPWIFRCLRPLAAFLALTTGLPAYAGETLRPGQEAQTGAAGLEEALQPSSSAGLEEKVPDRSEMRLVTTLQMGDLRAELAQHAGKFYLHADSEVFLVGDRLRRTQYLPLNEETLVFAGTDPSNSVVVAPSQRSVDRRHAAFLLDFGEGVRVINLSRRGGMVVGEQGVQPPPALRIGQGDYFLFQGGNRYFIAGPKLEGPDRFNVPFLEIPFRRVEDRRVPRRIARASLGRSLESDVRIDAPNVSREQAEFFLMRNGKVMVQDAGATNPTRVDGEEAVNAIVVCDPLAEWVQVELSDPYPGLGGMVRASRELMFLDPGQPGISDRLLDAAQRFSQGFREAGDPVFPVILFQVLTLGSDEDPGRHRTAAMENYLGGFIAILLSRLRLNLPGQEISDGFSTFIVMFLLGDYPDLQVEAALACRDLRFSTSATSRLCNIWAGMLGSVYAGLLRRDERLSEVAGVVDEGIVEAILRRNAALLEALGSQRGLDHLIDLVRDHVLDAELKLEAIAVMDRQKERAHTNSLFQALSVLTFDESKPVALAAMDALAKMDRPEAALVLGLHAFSEEGEERDPDIQRKAEALFIQLVDSVISTVSISMADTQEIQLPDPPLSEDSAAGLEEGGQEVVRRFRDRLHQRGVQLLHVQPEVAQDPDLWKQLARVLGEPVRMEAVVRGLDEAEVPAVQIGWGLELHREKTPADPGGSIARVNLVVPEAGRESPFQEEYGTFARALAGASMSKEARAVRLGAQEGIQFKIQADNPEGFSWTTDPGVWEIRQGLLDFLKDREVVLSLEVPSPRHGGAGETQDFRTQWETQWAWILDPRNLHINVPQEGGTDRWRSPYPLVRPGGEPLSLRGFVDGERREPPGGQVVPARFVILYGTSPELPWVYEPGITRHGEGRYRIELSRYPAQHPVRRMLDLLARNDLRNFGLQGGCVLALLKSRALKDLDIAFVLSREGEAHRVMEDEAHMLQAAEPLSRALGVGDTRMLFPGFVEANRLEAPRFENKPVELLMDPLRAESGEPFPGSISENVLLLSIVRMALTPDWSAVEPGQPLTHAILLDPYGGAADFFQKKVRLIGRERVPPTLTEAVQRALRIIERMALEGLRTDDADPDTDRKLKDLRDFIRSFTRGGALHSLSSEEMEDRLRRTARKVHPSGPAALQLLEEFGVGGIAQGMDLSPEELFKQEEDAMFGAGLEEADEALLQTALGNQALAGELERAGAVVLPDGTGIVRADPRDLEFAYYSLYLQDGHATPAGLPLWVKSIPLGAAQEEVRGTWERVSLRATDVILFNAAHVPNEEALSNVLPAADPMPAILRAAPGAKIPFNRLAAAGILAQRAGRPLDLETLTINFLQVGPTTYAIIRSA